ncbi:MAG: hypothetical protein ACRCWO_09970 [Bosea sp. (in: a-proteobacteria)]
MTNQNTGSFFAVGAAFLRLTAAIIGEKNPGVFAKFLSGFVTMVANKAHK